MQKYSHYKKQIFWISGFCLAVILFCTGIFLGGKNNVRDFVRNNTPFLAPALAQTDLEKIESMKPDMAKFWNVWNILEQKYPFKENIPATDDKIYGALTGLVASYGDPYTMFFPPENAKLFAEDVKGEFGGVGMEVGVRDGFVIVIAPLKDSPAYRAGIKPGDIIVSVDDHKITDTNVSKIVGWIRGTEGSTVHLKVARKDVKEILDISIVRSKINVPIIDTEIKGDVFVIHFYSFSEKSAVLFNHALDAFIESGKKKLLIDMRSNPGGYLDSAVEIASAFIPAGDVIVKEDNGTGADQYLYRSRGYAKIDPSVTVGVLVDQGSASASEILAGALQDHKRAVIYGTRSFGKGSVQELIPLDDGSSVKITIAKWYTPNGVSISEKGITPNVVFDLKKLPTPKPGEDVLLVQTIKKMSNSK